MTFFALYSSFLNQNALQQKVRYLAVGRTFESIRWFFEIPQAWSLAIHPFGLISLDASLESHDMLLQPSVLSPHLTHIYWQLKLDHAGAQYPLSQSPSENGNDQTRSRASQSQVPTELYSQFLKIVTFVIDSLIVRTAPPCRKFAGVERIRAQFGYRSRRGTTRAFLWANLAQHIQWQFAVLW